MMHDVFQWSGHWGAMMWGMGLWWTLVLILVVLAIAALTKYLFSGDRRRQ